MTKSQIPNPPYFNRELSWLAFNRRVLNLCYNKRFPLLERMRFLSIVSSNLDEFFEIRVAGLEQQLESGVMEVGFDGLGPREQLGRISKITAALTADEYSCWTDTLIPLLKREKIHFKTPKECSAQEKAWLKKYFEDDVYPALTPLAVDPAHPFPHLRNKGLYVLASLSNPAAKRAPRDIAIIPVPPILSRIIRLESPENEHKFVYLSDTIKHYAELLFPGYKVRNSAVFRITRNSELYIDVEESQNLLQTIENELHNRRKGAAVRLEIESCVSEGALKALTDALDLDENFIYKIPASPLNLARLSVAYDMIDRPDLKFPPFRPVVPREFANGENFFDIIRAHDRLLHHPYDSFAPVEEFIKQSARDKDVLAIKLTLYRTSEGSPILSALKEAASLGKQVTVLIELKARFDEENNIQWARELEERGVHVVYGMVDFKTHCKTCLVVRRENGGVLRRYVHLGTGNYNSKTAKIYTDLSFFTANEAISREVASLFNTLTGKVAKPEFDKLIVAPFNFRQRLLELIARETENAKKGKSARIIMKMNSLVEKESIDALYAASNAGVKIDLIVRGICALIPQVKGLSSNITVRSIVGQYLEHSRIYYFENGGNAEVFAGSADVMTRNMYRRIECIFPVEDPDIKKRIVDEILGSMLRENLFATVLHANGAYYADPAKSGEPEFSCQEFFMENAAEKNHLAQGNL